MSSGLWHWAQFLKKIGATSLLKVTWSAVGLSLSFASVVVEANKNPARSKASKQVIVNFRLINFDSFLRRCGTSSLFPSVATRHEGSCGKCGAGFKPAPQHKQNADRAYYLSVLNGNH